MPKEFYNMDWEEAFERLNALGVDASDQVVYGVPRGGMCACMMLGQAQTTHRPDCATIILDDIIDSGTTHERYQKAFPDVPFVSLVDKIGADREEFEDTWIVFPWEAPWPGIEAGEDAICADVLAGPADNVVRLLNFIGEDANRDGLKDTPQRVLRSLQEMTSGYHEDVEEILGRVFDQKHDEMIISKGIRFSSLCEHHILPFTGVAAVGYVPSNGKIVGLSKLARAVQVYSKRLQVQERLTTQVADAIMQHRKLKPQGVGVIMKAHHSCMGCRGANQPDSEMVTSCMYGLFREDAAARAEFLRLSGMEA